MSLHKSIYEVKTNVCDVRARMADPTTHLPSPFSNESRGETTEPGFSPVMKTLVVTYYSVIFILAGVGNALALLTCYKNYRSSTSVVLCFIANLATADLLFTLLTTFDLAYFLTGSWVGGIVTCKAQNFLIETTYMVSILTLVAISHERIRSVSAKKLVRSVSMRVGKRKFVVGGIWFSSALTCSPVLYATITKLDTNSESSVLCVNTAWGDIGRQIYYTVRIVLLLLPSLGFMIWAHWKIFKALRRHVLSSSGSFKNSLESSTQRRITKMLALVTTVFIVCYIPFAFVRTLRYFRVYTGDELWRMSQLFVCTQPACNPIIYCCYSNQFRGSFKSILGCKICNKEQEVPQRPTSSFISPPSVNTYL